jgi:hypothetical protein
MKANKEEKRRYICISYHPSVFKIMKQRKNREARKHNMKDDMGIFYSN